MSDEFGLGSIVKGAIEGLGKQGREWIDWWRKNKREQQPMKIVDEMLRNPKYHFRETRTLARAIYDTTDNRIVTVTILQQMGARHNIGDRDTWTMDKYWEENPRGSWKLRGGVEPGRS